MAPMKPKQKPRKPLPSTLYSTESIRKLENIAINEYNIAGYELMKRAGKALFNYFQDKYPLARHVTVFCGSGNNAGDGYIFAWLAMQAKLKVSVVSLVGINKLQGDAKFAWKEWHARGHQKVECSDELLKKSDVIIDALLGTGLSRDVDGEWAETIDAINNSGKPVISVDIPSGLYADTGRIAGHAVQATSTMTFIGLKKGLFTHNGVDHCGDLLFEGLGLPAKLYSKQPAQAHLLNWPQLQTSLKPRSASTHKHQCGHLLILGGDWGMPGAVRLVAEAALRAGAGLVTVVTHALHAPVILSAQPEIMLLSSGDGHVPEELLSKVDALVVGPGLSDSHWSQNLLSDALSCAAPKVIDAGALRLLSQQDEKRDDWILTPHPGEAAAMLGETSECIQDSRFSSAELLQQKHGGHVLLKGAGSILQSPGGLAQLCPYGNPGMASAGMGDVLSGVLGGLLVQGYNLQTASRLGVCIHSIAGDVAAAKGQIGLLASDLYPNIRQLMNSVPAKRKNHA